MNFKSKFQNVSVILSACIGLLVTTPVMAMPVGTISLDITGGCFSFGASGATGCGNTDLSHIEYATGSFSFANTLSPLNPSTENFSYDAFANLSATNGTTNFDNNRSKSFPSFSALTSDPRWAVAAGLVLAFGASPVMGSLPPSLGVNLSWLSVLDPGSTPTNTSGSFEIWSNDDLNVLSQALFNRDLPFTEVSFTSDARLEANAVSEPISLALIGLGLFAMSTLRRRRVS